VSAAKPRPRRRESDNVHDPGYEIVSARQVYDGPDEVREYFATTRTAFPDQRNELVARHHGDDARSSSSTSRARTRSRSGPAADRETRSPAAASRSSASTITRQLGVGL